MSQPEDKKRSVAKPPAHFDRETRRFYLKMIEDFPWLAEPGFKERLIAACDARARYMQASAAIKEHGLTCLDRFGQLRPRPEISIEATARGQFYRFMAGLGLKKSKKPTNKTGARAR